MRLDKVKYDESLDSDESNLETLVASCPVLEKLTVIRDLCFELLGIMRVRSKSLKSLALGIEDYEVDILEEEDHVVEIDAPRLEHMSVSYHLTGSIGVSRMHAWRSLLLLSRTLMFDSVTVIHDYSKLEQLPQFSNLTWLHGSFVDSFWKLLPTFLGCCPNLHTLVLEIDFELEGCPIRTLLCAAVVSSLNYLRFFLRNCAVLKKLTLSESIGVDIIKKIKRIRRKSRRCIIVTG
ncbi:hypothetical protein N665_2097s0003 [Sinapis alba]|nr:hypothetical protein N665_2097s0003 [Sinapis alba]